jgi:hypothetical protein
MASPEAREVMELLVEGPEKRRPGRLRGRLRNGRLCHVEGKLEEFLGHGAHGATANASGGILSIYIYIYLLYIYIYSIYIYIYIQ